MTRASATGTAVIDASSDGRPRGPLGRRTVEPNFFVVGAPRAGTTSLWYSIGQHPQIFMPRAQKEPHFFCDYVRPWAVKTLEDYLALFDEVRDETAIGEASTGYLTDPTSPQRIRARYPDAKIVIMLRNPVDRVYSKYRVSCVWGQEWLPTFEAALAAEDQRAVNEQYRLADPFRYDMQMYFRSGLVADAVARYLETFSRDQTHIIIFEDFKADPEKELRTLFRFLDVNPDYRPYTDRQNQSEFPFWVRGHYATVRWWNRRGKHLADNRRVRAQRWCEAFLKVNSVLGGAFRPREVQMMTRTRLMERYAKDVEATAQLIGRDLSAWTKHALR